MKKSEIQLVRRENDPKKTNNLGDAWFNTPLGEVHVEKHGTEYDTASGCTIHLPDGTSFDYSMYYCKTGIVHAIAALTKDVELLEEIDAPPTSLTHQYFDVLKKEFSWFPFSESEAVRIYREGDDAKKKIGKGTYSLRVCEFTERNVLEEKIVECENFYEAEAEIEKFCKKQSETKGDEDDDTFLDISFKKYEGMTTEEIKKEFMSFKGTKLRIFWGQEHGHLPCSQISEEGSVKFYILGKGKVMIECRVGDEITWTKPHNLSEEEMEMLEERFHEDYPEGWEKSADDWTKIANECHEQLLYGKWLDDGLENWYANHPV